MVFNELSIIIALLSVFFTWIGILTIKVVKAIRHYNRLARGISQTGLTPILESILQTQEGLKKEVSHLETEIRKMQQSEVLHLQQVGIVRFNPFSDTGGSQSFVLALLDGNDNGIVMTSLYARSGNRWYIKNVKSGRGVDLALSKEEETAIKTARPVMDLRIK